MEFAEFQVKGGAAPQYSIIGSLFDEKKIISYKDGERLICFITLIPPDFDGTGPLPLFEERKENGKVVEALRKIYSAQK